MKKVLIVLILVFSLLSISCNLISNGFNASMKDFFDENLGTARITGYEPLQTCYTGNDGYLNIPSASEFNIKLFLHNPQGYKFDLGKNLTIRMEDEEVNKDPNITGESDNLKLRYNIYSDPNDKTNSTLILHYSQSFLKNWEAGGDISPIITLSHPLSDETFGSYEKLKLRSNSPPPVSDIKIFKYLNKEKQCYCIVFTMPSKADLSGIHKDISKIEIKIEPESKTVDKAWNVKIEEDGAFDFLEGNQKTGCFEYGAGYEDVKRDVTYYSDVNFSSHSEIVCYITLYDKWGVEAKEFKRVEASNVSDYPDRKPVEENPNQPDEGDPNQPDEGDPNQPDEGDPNQPDEGDPNQPDEGDPEQPDEGDPEQPDEGDPNPPDEEKPDTPVEPINPSFEITLPANEGYEFTVKINNVKVSEEKIEVKSGGYISFDVKTKDGKPVSNGTFKISLKHNGEPFISGDNEIKIDEVPIGNYEIYMSVETDGIKLDRTLHVKVVKNGGRA